LVSVHLLFIYVLRPRYSEFRVRPWHKVPLSESSVN
jgi:hypothetical protein